MESRKFEIIKEISNRLKNENLKIIDIDGVRVESEDGWWGIRASNTENALTVRAEAVSSSQLKTMIKNIENQLELSQVNFKFSL